MTALPGVRELVGIWVGDYGQFQQQLIGLWIEPRYQNESVEHKGF